MSEIKKAATARCAVCGRPLRSAASMAAGVGPVCAGKGGGKGRRHRLRLTIGSSGVYDAGSDGPRLEPSVIRGGNSGDAPTIVVKENP